MNGGLVLIPPTKQQTVHQSGATPMLRRPPHRFWVNRKRVRRLMRELGLLREPKRKGVQTTDSRHPRRRFPNLVAGLEVVRPDQVWVADITYIRLGEGFVYLAVVMDVYTRGIRGWALSRFLDHGLALEALEMALEKGVPEIHHSDQGVQYAAKEYVELLEKHEVKISMARRGRPDENGYAERVIRTIKEEEVELSEYEGFWDAKERIGEFIEEVYQRKRIHSALGYLTPEEFEEKWHRERETAGTLSKDGLKFVQLLGSTTPFRADPSLQGDFVVSDGSFQGGQVSGPRHGDPPRVPDLGAFEEFLKMYGIPPICELMKQLKEGGMPGCFTTPYRNFTPWPPRRASSC